MEEINITDIVQNESKPITPMQRVVSDVQAKNPINGKKQEPLGVDFGEDLLFGTGIQEKQQKASLSFENTNMESAFANVGGEWISKYDTYKRGRDNDAYAAENQTTGDKWANGITKFGAKTLNAVVGGTVGVAYGAGAAISGGEVSKFYDNDFSNWMNDLDAKLNYQLPNYYTKQEQDKGVFGQLGTANFWADKFLGGISFTAGAIVSEGIWAWATGGTSLATSGVRFASKLKGLGAVGKWGVKELGEVGVTAGLAKNKSLFTSFELGKDATTASLSATRASANIYGKAGEVASLVGRTMRSAGYEASVEALQYKKEAEENFYRNFTSQNGREPSAEEVSQFEVDNNSAANAVFGANMAIVGTSNLILLGNVLNIKNPVNLGFNDFLNKKAFGYGVDKATNTVLKGSKLQVVNRNVFNYLVKPSATEGLFEEGLQGVTNKTANKWIEHTYDTKNSAETFSAMESFGQSLNEQYGTEEGWKDNMLGMLIGIAGGSVNVRAEEKQRLNEYDSQAKSARTNTAESLQAMVLPLRVQTANRMQGFAQEEKTEEAKGNLAKSQIAKIGQVTSYINSELVMGESVKSTTKKISQALDAMTEEQWNNIGIETENIEAEKAERISEFQTLAQEWQTNKDYVKYMIGDKMVGENALGSQMLGLEEIFGSFSNNAKVVEALTWQLTVGENSAKIMRDAQGTIGKEVGEEYQSTLRIISDLKQRSAESNKELNNLQKQYANAVQRRDSLEKRLINEQNAQKKSTERDGSLYRQLSLDFVKAEEEVTSAREQADKIAEELNINKKVLDGNLGIDTNVEAIGQTVSGEQLLKINENAKKFKDTLNLLEKTNNQRFKYLEGIINEYEQAESMFMQAKVTQKALTSPEFKISNIDGWIDNLFSKGKSMNTDTQEWFEDSIKNYIESKVTVIADGVRKGEEIIVESVDEAPKDLTRTESKSIEQINEEKIAELEAERQDKLSKVLANTVDSSIGGQGQRILKKLGYKNENRQPNGNIIGGQAGWKIRFNLKNPATGTSYYADGKDTLVDDEYNNRAETLTNFLLEYFGSNEKANKSNLAKHYILESEGQRREPFKHLSGGEIGESDFTIYTGSADDTLKFIQDVRDNHPEIYKLLDKGNVAGDVEIDDVFKGRIEGRSIGFSGYGAPSNLNKVLDSESYNFTFEGKGVNIDYGGTSNLSDIIITVEGGNKDGNYIGYNVVGDQRLKNDFPELYKNIRNIIGFQLYGEYLKGTNDEFVSLTGVSTENTQSQTVEEVLKESESQKKIDKINEEYDQKISELRGKTKIEEYRERIKNLLKNVYKSLDYLPQSDVKLSAVKPTREEIQEYNDLVKDGKQTTKRAQELRARLNDWKLLATAIDEDYTSIAELVDLINQLQENVNVQETKPEFTETEASAVMNSVASETDLGLADVKSMLNNTNQPVTARIVGEVIQLTHVKARYIVEKLGGEFTIVRGKKVINNKNLDNLQPGDVVSVNGLSFSIDDNYRVVFQKNDFDQARQTQTNLYIAEGESNLNFISVYSIFGQERVRAQSQFGDSEINTEESFKVQERDKLTLHVKDTDGRNATEQGGTMDELKIYVKNEAGDIVGNLKSGKAKNGASVDANFMAIRQQAFDVWNLQGKPESLDLGITVSANTIFLGSAQITQEETPISIEATERVILAKGYVLGEDIKIDDTSIKDVNLTYVKKLAKDNEGRKIPIIVFRRGNHNIAFPISLVKKDSPLDFDVLLQGTAQEIVLKVNRSIQDNNVEIEKLNFSDMVLDNSGEIVMSENVIKVKEAFENHKTFKTADEIASTDYKKENLVEDATIRIDLEDLPSAIVSPKIRIDLKSAQYKNSNDITLTQTSELVKATSDLYEELYRDYVNNSSTKYINSEGLILEDDPYLQFLDNNEPKKGDSDNNRRSNTSFLEGAMEILKGEGVSNIVKKAVGLEKINRANKLIERLNLLEPQRKVNKEKTKEGKNNC